MYCVRSHVPQEVTYVNMLCAVLGTNAQEVNGIVLLHRCLQVLYMLVFPLL